MSVKILFEKGNDLAVPDKLKRRNPLFAIDLSNVEQVAVPDLVSVGSVSPPKAT